MTPMSTRHDETVRRATDFGYADAKTANEKNCTTKTAPMHDAMLANDSARETAATTRTSSLGQACRFLLSARVRTQVIRRVTRTRCGGRRRGRDCGTRDSDDDDAYAGVVNELVGRCFSSLATYIMERMALERACWLYHFLPSLRGAVTVPVCRNPAANQQAYPFCSDEASQNDCPIDSKIHASKTSRLSAHPFSHPLSCRRHCRRAIRLMQNQPPQLLRPRAGGPSNGPKVQKDESLQFLPTRGSVETQSDMNVLSARSDGTHRTLNLEIPLPCPEGRR